MKSAEVIDSEFTHFVLTRFNLSVFPERPLPSDEWLRSRVALFRRYCIPSFTAQRNGRFRWIVLLDEKSPLWLMEELAVLSKGGLFEPVYLAGGLQPQEVSKLLKARTTTPFILTTRVDNDDAVAVDFISTIQESLRTREMHFINLVTGAQFAAGRFYLRPYTKNPFVSLFEPVADSPLLTVYVDQHTFVDRHAPVRNIVTSRVKWLQVVHGENVGNEIVGLEVSGRRVLKRFPLGMDPGTSWWNVMPGSIVSAGRILRRMVAKPDRIHQLLVAMAAVRIGRR